MWFKGENCSWTVMEIMTLLIVPRVLGCGSRKQSGTTRANHLGHAGRADRALRPGAEETSFCSSSHGDSTARARGLHQAEGGGV